MNKYLTRKLITLPVYILYKLLGCTIIGQGLLMIGCMCVFPGIIFSIIPDENIGDPESYGQGVAIFGLLTSPFIGMVVMFIGDNLERFYGDGIWAHFKS